MGCPHSAMARIDTVPRLLLVEDSEDDAELICLELGRAGIEFHSRRVDNRQALIESLKSQQWDLILSDFAMPRFNGLEAFELVTALDLDIPFIFVSGAIGEERAVAAMRAGARDYITKDNLKRLSSVVLRELAELDSRRERRVAEEEASREARRLSMAVEASGAGIFELSAAPKRDIYVSERWADILGFTLDELPEREALTQWYWQRIHPDDQEAFEQVYADFLAGGASRFQTEIRLRHKDDSWISVALFCKALERDAKGMATHFVGVIVDLTERRRLEEDLRHAQKMEAIGRLAGGVAHDFNNLLTVIFASGEFVQDELEPGSNAAEDMEQLLEAAQRASELTRQLLAFSRRQPMEPKVLNPNGVLVEVQRMLRRLLGEDIELETQLTPTLGNVRIDPGAFEQVIVNMAVNARDAMPHGGRLTLSTMNIEQNEPRPVSMSARMPAGPYVQIEVADSGIGMTADLLEVIFEPFFTTKELGKGTGLGLSTCYGIVQQAGGYIHLESKPEQGTTFRIYLPRVPLAAEPQNLINRPAVLGGSETVLLVEDEDQVRRLVARTLSVQGYNVLEARDAGQGLREAEALDAPIDILVTDVVMRDMDGLQLAERLSASYPSMRVLYISGYTPAEIANRGNLDPSATILSKPFRSEDLLRTVRAVLDASADRA